MAKQDLTSAEVTELCSAGYDAWNKLGPHKKLASFKWRGERYVARHTGFRLCIDNAAGQPVVCRWE